jgi:hypothetical protein
VVSRIVRLIVKRRAEALLPWFTRPLLFLDRIVWNFVGNTMLTWKFPPEGTGNRE